MSFLFYVFVVHGIGGNKGNHFIQLKNNIYKIMLLLFHICVLLGKGNYNFQRRKNATTENDIVENKICWLLPIRKNPRDRIR